MVEMHLRVRGKKLATAGYYLAGVNGEHEMTVFLQFSDGVDRGSPRTSCR